MVLALPDRAEELESTLPRRMRRNIHMSHNRASRRGPMAIISAERSNLVPLLGELIRLHRERWASRNEPGVLAGQRIVQFHEMAVRRLFNSGLLRLYALRIGPSIVGAYYGFQHRERAYAYLMGFDPDYAFVSPGTILFAHALEEAVREGAREMDLLRGDERYKFAWGAEPRFNQRRIFRRSVRRAGAA
jgi:CelD/BcsL family acetyltransferase involved in cellulose biosynthesis